MGHRGVGQVYAGGCGKVDLEVRLEVGSSDLKRKEVKLSREIFEMPEKD